MTATWRPGRSQHELLSFSNRRPRARAPDARWRFAGDPFDFLRYRDRADRCDPSAFPASPSAAANEIPGIVVSATGDPTPASEIGSSVTVITADQIAAQQRRTLPDVLNQAPGLNVVQSGGPGTQTSVFIWARTRITRKC